MDESDETTKLILESCRFWIQRVLVPIVVCIGVVGNTITVMVLTRRRMRSSTNIYLSALAIADVIHLLFVLVLSFKHYNNIHDRKYELYWRFFGLTHWLVDAASSTSVWLTVSFTLERYIAVCHPIKGKRVCTENRAKSIITIVYIFCILTTASTTFEYQLNLQETCVKHCKPDEWKKLHQSSTGNVNVNHNGTTYHIQHHNLSPDDPSIKRYNEVLNTQLKILLANCSTQHSHIIYVPIYPHLENQTNGVILPVTTTQMPKVEQRRMEAVVQEMMQLQIDESSNKNDSVVGNKDEGSEVNATCCLTKKTIDTELTSLGLNTTYTTFIYWYSAVFFILFPLVLIATFNCFLVKAVFLSQKQRKAMTNSQENIYISNENRITVMLIGVVLLFIICQTPTASLLIYTNITSQEELGRHKNILLVLGNIFNFLVTVNSAFNFVLYCVLSRKFRSTFRKLFCERRKKKQDTIMLSSTKSRNSQKFNPYKHGVMRRNASEYRTPRNLETQSLTGIPRSKSLMTRPLGKVKSDDLVV